MSAVSVDVKIHQTLRNARFIGEMAVKGVERQIRSLLTPPVQSHQPETKQPATTTSSLDEPFEGYDLLTARQIIAQCREWTPAAREDARHYELSTRARRSVIQALS